MGLYLRQPKKGRNEIFNITIKSKKEFVRVCKNLKKYFRN